MTYDDDYEILSYYKSRINFMDESIATRYLYLRICSLEKELNKLKEANNGFTSRALED